MAEKDEKIFMKRPNIKYYTPILAILFTLGVLGWWLLPKEFSVADCGGGACSFEQIGIGVNNQTGQCTDIHFEDSRLSYNETMTQTGWNRYIIGSRVEGLWSERTLKTPYGNCPVNNLLTFSGSSCCTKLGLEYKHADVITENLDSKIDRQYTIKIYVVLGITIISIVTLVVIIKRNHSTPTGHRTVRSLVERKKKDKK